MLGFPKHLGLLDSKNQGLTFKSFLILNKNTNHNFFNQQLQFQSLCTQPISLFGNTIQSSQFTSGLQADSNVITDVQQNVNKKWGNFKKVLFTSTVQDRNSAFVQKTSGKKQTEELSLSEIFSILMQENIHIVKILFIVFGTVSIIGVIFGEKIKKFFSHQGAEVASRSIQSKEVKNSVNVLSKDVLFALLRDPNTLAECTSFLEKIAKDPKIQAEISSILLNTVLGDAAIQTAAGEFIRKELIEKTLANKDIQNSASKFLQTLLENEELKKKMTNFANQLMADPSVRTNLNDLLVSVADSPVIQQKLVDVGSDAAQKIFEDPRVFDKATEFIQSVVNDKTVQQDTADALWEAFKLSVTPSLFVQARNNAAGVNSSEQEGESIENGKE